MRETAMNSVKERLEAMPCSAETSAPSLPLWAGSRVPSGPKQIWPEMTTRLPVRI
jgi:hypothetical protein